MKNYRFCYSLGSPRKQSIRQRPKGYCFIRSATPGKQKGGKMGKRQGRGRQFKGMFPSHLTLGVKYT